MRRTKIGFFDSGVGGLTVLACARKQIPAADYLFYADTDHVPYGTKTREEVTSYAMDAVGALRDRGADAVVIACNTATSMAVDELRRSFSIPIVGMEPAVKPAAQIHPGEKILVCATPLTIAGEKLHTLIDRSFHEGIQPTLVPLPGLVTMAEEECFEEDEVTAYLDSVIDRREKYAAVVLGCTHFTYFRSAFRAFFGDIDLIDGNRGTVRRLASLLGEIPGDGEGTLEILESGREVNNLEHLARYERLYRRAEAIAEEAY